MPAFESLPPDQRAVLQLVLAQGRSYEDLSALLHLEPEAVALRARGGAEALVPEGVSDTEPEARGEVVDYLLGQQGVSARGATRRLIAGSAPLAAWAGALSSELGPIAKHGLPEVPAAAAAAEPDAEEPLAAPAPAEPVAEEEPTHGDVAAAHAAEDADALALDEGASVQEELAPRRSLLGGALLLAGLAVFVIVLVIALLHHDSSADSGASSAPPDTSAAASTQATTTTGSASQVQTLGQANLAPADGSKALAVAQLKVQGNAAGFDINAQGLKTIPGTYHAVWLEGAKGKMQFLGAVLNQDVSSGRFRRVARVPPNITSFNRMIISREPITASKQTPAAPSTIVLAGPLKLVNG